VKRMLTLGLLLMFVFSATAFAQCYCDCNCWACSCNDDPDLIMTTLIVGGEEWDYEVKTNVRSRPDIDSRVVGDLSEGTQINVTDFYYTEDGRIWAEIWYKDNYAYVSVKYLEVLPDEGSYFYLPYETEVFKSPDGDSRKIARFVGDHLVLVTEIVTGDGDGEYWAKVVADGKYGYIRFLTLDAVL